MSAPTKDRAPAGATAATGGGGSPFTGTSPLLRLALRRDRVLVPVWVLFFGLMAYSSAAATTGIYPDVASRAAASAAVNETVAIRALYGPIWDVQSLGQIALFKFNALGMALVAVLSFMLVTRHTRAEEEDGRLELLGAGVVGRYAPLSAGLLLAAVTNVVLAVVTALFLTGAGLPADGSLAFALTWMVAGLAFAAVAGVAAQLTTSARAANGIAASVLGVAYTLRALGDAGAGTSWLSWLSPIGWAQQVKAFSDNRWALLLLPLLFGVAVAASAYAVVNRRDLGAGLLADRAGRARATSALGSPFGLALRLQRGTLIAWTAGYTVMGLVFGSLVNSVGNFMDSAQSRDFLKQLGGLDNLTEAYLATVYTMAAVITSVFVVQSVLRLRSEEATGRAEATLATGIGRRAWAAGHVAVAVLGAVWLLFWMSLLCGLLYGAASGQPQVGRLLGAAAAQLPAVLVLAGIALAAYAISPRLASVGWAFLVVCFFVDGVGPVLKLSHWILDLTPFSHVPRLPGGTFSATPLVWLSVIALALLGFGFERLRRRDLG